MNVQLDPIPLPEPKAATENNRVFSKNCAFFSKCCDFFLNLPVLAARQKFDVHTHWQQGKPEFRIYLKVFEKNKIINEHPVSKD